MRFKKVVIVALALSVLPLAGAFARGAGGFTWGEQYFDQSLSNINLGTSDNGVYGYSTTYGGQRIGGFALAMHSDAIAPAFNAGFIGAIGGQEVRIGPFMGAVTAWTGFGGMNTNPLYQGPAAFALFGELNVEAGFGFLPGVMLTCYAGLQAVAQVFPEQAFIQNTIYTPVMGMRIAWGS
jgi:hypothetical protein